MQKHEDLFALPERIPNFFIVGGPKCGTTSLFEWLRRHPDTYLPVKEPNFLSRDVFDARDVPGAVTDWGAYLNRLMPIEHADKITGESTPRYLYSDIALELLSRHNSRPKILIILRNPIDLVFSLHGQMLRQGVERETDFDKAWTRSIKRSADLNLWKTPSGSCDRRLDYSLFGKLGERVALWKQRFSDDQLRILILEETLAVDPKKEFAEILDFLGLPPVDIELSRENERSELRSVAAQRQLIKLRNLTNGIVSRLGLSPLNSNPQRRRGTGVLKMLLKLNSVNGEQSKKLDPQSRQTLANYFSDDAQLLFETIGRDIPAWLDWNYSREGSDELI